MIPNCAATRHAHFVLDGSGPAEFEAPKLSDWPAVTWTPDAASTRVNLDTLTRRKSLRGNPGSACSSPASFTGRDAAHKRIQDFSSRENSCPLISPIA